MSNQHKQPPSPRIGSHIDMTRHNLLGSLLLLSWPIIVSQLLQLGVGIADMKMISYLGAAAIAAVTTSWSVITIVMSLAFAVATGTQVLVAQHIGARNSEAAHQVVKQSLLLICSTTLLLVTPAGLAMSRWLLGVVGADDQVIGHALPYMQITFALAIFLLPSFILNGALRGAGDTITPLVTLALVNVLNIGFDYLLIFGKLGLPAMGVAGAALGSCLARAIGLMLLAYVFLSGRFVLTLRLRTSWRIHWRTWWLILYIGIPSSVQAFARNIAFAVVIWILNKTPEGSLAVAAHGLAGQVRGISIMVGLAMMSAAMTAVGQNLGAHKPQRASRSGWAAMHIALAFSFLFITCYLLLGRPIIGFFAGNMDPTVMSLGVLALWVLAICEPFLMSSMALSGALRGAGDTMTPLWVSLITTTGIGPVLSYLLAITAALGPVGVWLGYDVASIVGLALLAFKFHQGRWQQYRLVNSKTTGAPR